MVYSPQLTIEDKEAAMTIDPQRLQALEDLVSHRIGVAEACHRLAGFGWDEDERVELSRSHVLHVLEEFRAGRIDATELTAWADAVDSRDDLGREPGAEETVNDVLFVLSSPELMDRPLSDLVPELAARLGRP